MISATRDNILRTRAALSDIKNYYARMGQAMPGGVVYFETQLFEIESTFLKLKNELQKVLYSANVNIDLGVWPIIAGIGIATVGVGWVAYVGMQMMRERSEQLRIQVEAERAGLHISPLPFLGGSTVSSLLPLALVGGAGYLAYRYLGKKK